MAISGTVPFFDYSICPEQSPTVITVTGSASGTLLGLATGSGFGTEALGAFFRRCVSALALSGVRGNSGNAVNLQCFSGSVVSGIVQIQRELAFRVADLEVGGGAPNSVRLASAQAIVAAAGEAQVV